MASEPLVLPNLISNIRNLSWLDFAVEMFQVPPPETYQCYLKADTRLPMVHIDDVISAFNKLITAPGERLSQRVFNIHGFDITPAELAKAIEMARGAPVNCEFKPDFRQAIADTWPNSLDDTVARRELEWAPIIDTVAKLVNKMVSA